ncbi:E3 ubiquitin-protein ligase TRAF7-like isoform X1 [Apostichopus japonicus]|uniref:E3 ubiquitin-protein ligase TRAF7-like isoform X1 n=2 Tax=Stichopus japonicus TaxID=307972 RepID=UPI003AB4C551
MLWSVDSLMSQKPLFVEAPSSHLYCPTCSDILSDPVISVACGHTFCRACLCNSDGTVKVTNCPVDQTFIQNGTTVDNRAILSQIQDLRIYCRNGMKRLNSRNDTVVVQNGCPEVLSIASAATHVCQFDDIECPNSPICGKFKKGELADHLSYTCCFVSCPNKGCSHHGTLADIRQHQTTCPFFMSQLNSSINTQTNSDETITTLFKKIGDLEQSRAVMEQSLTEQRNLIQTLERKLKLLEGEVQSNQKRLDVASVNRQRPRTSSTNRGQKLSLSASFESHLWSREAWHLPFEFKCIGTLRGHQGAVHSLAIHRDKLYSGGSDCVIKVWNLLGLSKGCVQELRGHTKQVVALVAGQIYLYSAALDKTIRCWNYETPDTDVKIIKNAHDEDICALIMAGSNLFSSSKSEVKIWKADTLEFLKAISGLHHWVRALALDPHEENLYCGSHNTVTVWDATSQFSMKKKMDHLFGSVFSLAVSNTYLFVGTEKKGIVIFHVTSHQLLKTLEPLKGCVVQLMLSPDMNYLVSSHSDSTVEIYHLENFLSIQVLSRHYGSVNCLAVKSSKGLLCSGSDDQEIKIFTYFPLTTHSAYGIHI